MIKRRPKTLSKLLKEDKRVRVMVMPIQPKNHQQLPEKLKWPELLESNLESDPNKLLDNQVYHLITNKKMNRMLIKVLSKNNKKEGKFKWKVVKLKWRAVVQSTMKWLCLLNLDLL